MSGSNRIIIYRFFLVVFLILYVLLDIANGNAEESIGSPVWVIADQLNGRSAPRKKASIEARFDSGDILTATGKWSKDHKWIEVAGGETGTVWVSVRYVTGRRRFLAINRDYKAVKVRKWPESGRVVKYISKGKTVEIQQVVLGWGKTEWGWVDLYYLEEV